MIISIHQPQFLPWLGYFEKMARADVFVLLDDVQFKKNEWQNRNRIRTSQGCQWLTVPVLHNFGQSISEIKTNNKEDWQKSHLKALELNYCKAPYFNQYFGYFEKIYNEKWEKLVDINIRFILQLVELLGIQTKIVQSSSYNCSNERTQRLIDLCKHFHAKTYLAGEGGQHYLDPTQFEQDNIQVTFQKYEHPTYPQMWMHKGDFISHLSIADLLFNCGPNALSILKGKGSVV
jgi:hypothetical protein